MRALPAPGCRTGGSRTGSGSICARSSTGPIRRPRGAAPAGEVDALIARSPFARLARARLVFVNGLFDAARSQLPASGDVEFVRLASDGAPQWLTQTVAADGKDPISALNAAFVSDGGALRIAAGATADAPIELLFVTTAAEPSTLTTRNVIVLEEGACATIIETHLGGARPMSPTASPRQGSARARGSTGSSSRRRARAAFILPTSTPMSARAPPCAISR
jgi:hypothetical protein